MALVHDSNPEYFSQKFMVSLIKKHEEDYQ